MADQPAVVRAGTLPGSEVPPGLLLPGRQKALILGSVLLALFLAALDATVVGVALPRVVADLGGLDLFAWPITAYLLSSTVTVPVIGRLSDLYGRKPLLMAGIVVFLIGSALSGAAGTMEALIGFRTIQGFGAGLIMANAFTILGDLFAPADRARWMGLFAGTFALANVVGPLAGGLITDNASWRWVFYINLPIGAVALIAVSWQLPWFRTAVKAKVDYLGGAILIVAGTSLLLGFSWAGNQFGWGETPVVAAFAIAAISIAGFVFVEARAGDDAVLPLRLFTNRVFLVIMVVAATTGVAMFGVIQFMPLFLQGAQGVSAANSGTVTMPLALGLVAGSVLSGQLQNRLGIFRPLAIVGGLMMISGNFLLSTLDGDSSATLTRGYMVLVGLGIGLAMPLFSVAIQNALPYRLLGVGTASNQFFRQIGATIGIAMFGSLLASGFASKLAAAFPSGVDALRDNPQLLLDPDRLARFHATVEARAPGTADGVVATAREALGTTVTDLFFVAAIVMIVAVSAMTLLPKIQLRSRADVLAEAKASRDGPS